jgi:hypothetical protein
LSKKNYLAPSNFCIDIERAPGSSQFWLQPAHARVIVSFGLKTKLTKMTKMTKKTKMTKTKTKTNG